MKQTIETFGRLAILINNAGYAIYASLEELSGQEFRQSLEVNLFGRVNTIRNGMPCLRKRKAGHIINFSSLAGVRVMDHLQHIVQQNLRLSAMLNMKGRLCMRLQLVSAYRYFGL